MTSHHLRSDEGKGSPLERFTPYGELLIVAIVAFAMTILLDRYCRMIVGKLGFSEQYTRLAVLWLLRGSLFLGLAAVLFLLSTATIFEMHG